MPSSLCLCALVALLATDRLCISAQPKAPTTAPKAPTTAPKAPTPAPRAPTPAPKAPVPAPAAPKAPIPSPVPSPPVAKPPPPPFPPIPPVPQPKLPSGGFGTSRMFVKVDRDSVTQPGYEPYFKSAVSQLLRIGISSDNVDVLTLMADSNVPPAALSLDNIPMAQPTDNTTRVVFALVQLGTPVSDAGIVDLLNRAIGTASSALVSPLALQEDFAKVPGSTYAMPSASSDSNGELWYLMALWAIPCAVIILVGCCNNDFYANDRHGARHPFRAIAEDQEALRRKRLRNAESLGLLMADTVDDPDAATATSAQDLEMGTHDASPGPSTDTHNHPDDWGVECPDCGSRVLAEYMADHRAYCTAVRPAAPSAEGGGSQIGVDASIVCSMCRQTILARDLSLHEEQCEGRIVECNSCGKRLSVAELDRHRETSCPNINVQCPNLCGVSVVRKELPDHLANSCAHTGGGSSGTQQATAPKLQNSPAALNVSLSDVRLSPYGGRTSPAPDTPPPAEVRTRSRDGSHHHHHRHAHSGSGRERRASADPPEKESTGPRWVGVIFEEEENHRTGLRCVRATTIHPGSPADDCGMREKDIVTNFANTTIQCTADFGRVLHEVPLYKPVPLEVYRDGPGLMTLHITIKIKPKELQ